MIGKLKEKILIAKDTYEITFSLSEKITFQPGQYVTVSIPHAKHQDYQMNERIFSLVNSPTQNHVAKILFRYRDSGFKKNIVEMVAGAEVEIGEPVGMFELPKNETIPLVFLATGVGVSPFMSVLSFLREQNSKREINFFFSNYSLETTPYLSELRKLSEGLNHFKIIPIMTRDNLWSGEKERISLKMIQARVPEFIKANFFLAGLPEFVDDMVRELLRARIVKNKIQQESFDGY